MKSKDIRIASQLAGLFLLAGALGAQAQTTQIKAANATALSSGASWVSTTAPGSGDIGEWNSVATATGDTITSLGGAYSLGEIQLANNVAGAVSITDATATDILTLNGATGTGVGIDMSAANQNLTLGTPLTLGASQTWKITTGRTMNLTGVNWINFGANIVTVTGGGTVFYEPTTPFTTGPSSSAGAGLVINGSTFSVDIQKTASSGVANYLGANTSLTMTPSTTAFSIYNLGEVGSSGNHTQTFTSLTLNPGTSLFGQYVGRGSSSGNCVGFTVIHRNGGAIADFINNGGNAWGGSANDYGLPEPASGTISMGYATASANDWASPKGAAVDMSAVTYTADTFTTATADVNETTSDSPAAFTINSLRFNTAAANTLTLTGANTITSGGILVGSTVAANTTTITGGTLTSGNANADGTSDLIVINNTASSGNIIINSTIVDNGATSVGLTVGTTSTTTPTGSIQLDAANTFSGKTSITKGTLLLNNSLALQNSTLYTSLPGTLSFGSLTTATLAGVSGSGTLALPANFALTVGNNNVSSTSSGAITGAGATVTKIGTGTLTLNGANAYTGNTTVSAGTLALGPSGSLNGPVSITSTATLDVSAAGNFSLANTVSGTGTVNGALTLSSGGQLSPTGTSGVLTLSSNLTLNGGTCLISVNAAGPANGIINIGSGGVGNLTLNSGTIQLNITGGLLADGTYKIIGVPNGTITGSGSSIAVSGFAQTGQQAAIVANNTTHELDLVVVTYISQNLIWVGDGSANLWNVDLAANWNDIGPTVADPSVFRNGDNTTLDDSSANTTVNLAGTLSPASVTVNGSQSYTLTSSGKISGSATLADNSSGTLTVLTTNDYTGGTTIAGGATIQVGNGTTTGGAIGSGPVVDNSSLVFDLPSGSSQSLGTASGSGTLTTIGNGTLVLNGADALAGDTTITAGILRQGGANVLPNGSGEGNMVVNGTLGMGGLSGTVNSLSGGGIIDNTLSGNPVLSIGGNNADGNFSGVIKNTIGSLAVNKIGTGTLVLSATNTYSGGTTVTAGTLQLGNSNSISSYGLNVLANGTLDLNGFSPTVDSLTGGGIVDDVSAGGNLILSIGNNNGSGTFSGVIQNTSGTINLVKNGTGTEIMSGVNTYSGYTTVNGGLLQIPTGGSISTTTIGGQGFVVDGGSLTVSATSALADAGNAFLETAGTVNLATLGTSTSADGTLYEITGGSFTASAVNIGRTWGNATGPAPTAAAPLAAPTTSGFYINGPTANVSLGSLTVGTAAANSDASARMDDGILNVSGEVLVGNNSGGRWTAMQVTNGLFSAGSVVIGPNNGANTINAELYLSGPGTNIIGEIDFGAAADTLGGTGWLFVNGGASLYVGSGGIQLPNTQGYVATVELTSGLLGATADWSSSLPMNLNGTTFTIQTADNYGDPYHISLAGVLSETASAGLVVTGGGKLTLSGANQYNSGTVVNNSTLLINGIYALGGGNYNGLTLTNGSTLQYAAAFTGNGSGDLTSVGSAGVTLAAGNETIDVNGNNVTYANSIGNSGSGSLTLQSTIPGGVLNLQAINTYTGNTIISGGTLNVNGSIASANVTVNNGGALGGNGTVSGNVEIQYDGILSPGGLGVGTNHVGSLTLDSGSTNNFEFNGTANDQTVVTTSGGFVINDSSDNVVFNLYTAGGTTPWTTAGTYKLIQYSGAIGGTGLDSSWTTSSGTNPHIANPQLNCLYAFGSSGGYLTLTITLNASAVAGVWTNNADGNWSAGVNWSSNPNVPHLAGDTATFGDSTAFRTVALDANEIIGSLTFNNANSFAIANDGKALTIDNTGIGANVYVLGGTANSLQTAVALNDNATITVGSGNSLAVSGIISNSVNGAKTLVLGGSGTLTLSGNNSYGPAASSGYGTTVNGLTLKVGNNNALAAGDVSITGNSTLQAGAAGLNLPNNFDLASGATATVDNNGNNLTLGGNLSDSGALTKIGNGTLTLSGNNSYSGNTTVNAGVLSLSASQNVQSTPTIILNGGDLLGNGTFSASPNIGIGPTSGSVPGTALIDAASGQSFTLYGNITSAGNTGTNNLVINSGTGNDGMVILSGVNTFKGSTVISNGLLDVQSATALQNSTLLYSNQGGFLVFDSGISAATLGGLTGTQNLALTNLGSGGVTLTVGNNGSSTLYSGNMNDAGLGGAFTKAGAGTFTFTGTGFYTGATTVSGGILELTNGAVIAGGAANVASTGGAELLIDGGSLTATNASDVGYGSLGLRVSAGSASFLDAINANHNQTTPSPINVTGGYLTAASLTLGRTGLSDTTQPTAGDNTGNGLYISNGIVNIIGNLNMGTSSGANSTVNARIDAGSLTVGGAILIGLNNGGRWSVVDVNGGTLTVTDVVTGISIGNAQIGDAELLIRAGTVNAGIIGLGYGTVADTVVLNQTGGALYLGSGGIVQVSPNVTESITLGGGLLGASTNWSCTNSIQLTGTNYTIQTADTNGNPQNIYLGGPLSGTGALIKTGSGTLVLSNADTCTGATTINNGILALVPGSSLASTPEVAMATGAILDVSQLSGYALTGASPVQTLAGVSSSGVASVNAVGSVVTLASGAKALLNAAGGGSPTVGKISVTGSLALNGNVITINVSGGTLGAGTYRLLDCTGTLTGSASGTPTFTGLGITPGATASVSTTAGANGHVDLTVSQATPILETATASTIITGQALSASTLSVTFTNAAGVVVPGTAVFTSPGTVPPLGTANQPVLFTPTDTADYTTVSFNVSVTVVPSVIVPTIPPGITNFSLVGGNVVISGTNGQTGGTYYLLASTDLTKPRNQWKTVATNVLGTSNYTFIGTNAVVSGSGQQFYILSSTNYNP